MLVASCKPDTSHDFEFPTDTASSYSYQTAKEVAQDAREGLRSANFPIMLRLSELTEDGTKFWAVTVDREDADGCVTFHEPIRQLIIDNFKELNIFQDPPIRWFYNSFQFF